MRIGKKEFRTDGTETYLMGILNITEDSFSDGGRYREPEMAVRHALQMIEEGADLLDLGAESTRPGFKEIPADEELERLLPVIERLKRETDIPLSIDTRKARVMDAALAAGGDLANDIWGLRFAEFHKETGPAMAEVIARHRKPAVIMHQDLFGRNEAERTEKEAVGLSPDARNNVILRVREGLDRSLAIAEQAGIPKDQLILDPGIGFSKSTRESLQLLGHLQQMKRTGEVWLMAASRKSVIGDVLNLPPEEREEGTLVTSLLAAEAGFSFVRVHNIRPNKRALSFLQAVKNKGTF